MRRLGDVQSQAEKRRLKREAERGYLVCVEPGGDLPQIDAAGYATEDQEPILIGDYVAAVHAGLPERITNNTLWEAKRDSICDLAEVLKDAPRRGWGHGKIMKDGSTVHPVGTWVIDGNIWNTDKYYN